MKRRSYIIAMGGGLLSLAGCVEPSSNGQSTTTDEFESKEVDVDIVRLRLDDFTPSYRYKTYTENNRKFGIELPESDPNSTKIYVQSVAPQTNYELNLVKSTVIQKEEDTYTISLSLETVKTDGEIGGQIISYPDGLYKVYEVPSNEVEQVTINLIDGWGDSHQFKYNNPAYSL